KPNLLGRNAVSWAGPGLLGFAYDSPGLGADECYLQAGDSGAPSFELFADRLVVVGLHYGIQPGMSIDSGTAYSTSQILSLASAWGESLTSVYRPIPGDANMDGEVGLLDFSIAKANFGLLGTTWGRGDVNGDGQVGMLDLNIIKSNLGQTAGEAGVTVVPEPATLLCMLGLALPMMPKRRAKP
ncbi:MAG: dockerin type I repeat-containing protein, partial [Planctomycetota bacterium]|nr:dockerin type I repeat-containing protein [Planctomycetota bacterium]